MTLTLLSLALSMAGSGTVPPPLVLGKATEFTTSSDEAFYTHICLFITGTIDFKNSNFFLLFLSIP